jgi:hypothetical protein
VTARHAIPGSVRFAAALFSAALLIVFGAFIVQSAFAGTDNVLLVKTSDASEPVAPGASYDYTITATVGSLAANGLVITDNNIDVPQVSVDSALVAVGSNTATACVIDTSSNVSCAAGDVSANSTVTVTISVTVAATPNAACLNPNGSGTLDSTIRNSAAASWTDTGGATSSVSNNLTVDLNCSASTLPTPTPSGSASATPAPSATATPAPTTTPKPSATATPAPSNPFTDIDDSIFKNDIIWLAGQNITHGCTATTYCPNSRVLRDQMASFLVRALHLGTTTVDFFDDDNGNLHESNINRLAAAGLTSGCGFRQYCPRDPVNRDQMASFLSRAFHLAASNTNFFNDDNGNQHENQINALAASGITGGCAPGKYCPSTAVTRGQMAAFLHRAILR